jgi:hypothetical protein
MPCLMCASGKEAEFNSEISVHFLGLKSLDKPTVWIFPKLLVCLDCGFTWFTVPETELALLGRGTDTGAASVPRVHSR